MDGIVPAPVRLSTEPGVTVPLDRGVRVLSDADPEVLGAAVLAAGRLGAELDVPVEVVQEDQVDAGTTPGTIRLRLAPAAELGLPAELSDDVRAQAYALRVTADGTDLVATTAVGLTHAVATLVRLAVGGTTRESRAAGAVPALPAVTVLDHPWLPWRGVAVDLVREPLGVDGLRVVLAVMSALKLGVLHLPRAIAAPGEEAAGTLTPAGYAEVRAAAVARQIDLLPGVAAVPEAGTAGELVALTRARRVDVGEDRPDVVLRAAQEVLAAGAGVLAGQGAAAALDGLAELDGVVLAVHDVHAEAAMAAVRTAVGRGARVVLAVERAPGLAPMVHTAAVVDDALAALADLGVPGRAVVGVTAAPPGPSAPPAAVPMPSAPAVGTDAVGRTQEEEAPADGVAGRLLPWMTAVAEAGWSAPHDPPAAT